MDRSLWRSERRVTVTPLTDGIIKHPPCRVGGNDEEDDSEEQPGAYAVTSLQRHRRRVPEETQQPSRETIAAEPVTRDMPDRPPSQRRLDQSQCRVVGAIQSQDSLDQESLSPERNPSSPEVGFELANEEKHRKHSLAVILCFLFGILFIVNVVMGVVSGSKSDQQSVQGGDGGNGHEVEEDDLKGQRFEKCLIDGMHASVQFTDLKNLVFSNASPATIDDINTEGTYQRAALCWLTEVDRFFSETHFLTKRPRPIDDETEVNQRFALASIYYHFVPFGSLQTEGLPQSNWLSEAPACDWDFVACDGPDNRITELFMKKTKLNSFIPREVGMLSDLVYLKLTGMFLTGEVPSELFRLTKMEVLDLSLNLLSGVLPSEIGHLGQLRHVNFERNRFRGQLPASAFRIDHLKHFSVMQNSLTGSLPSTLTNATYLERLYLRANPALGGTIPDISQLTNLKEVLLGETSIIASLPDLSYSTRLVDLDLQDMQITGSIPSALGMLTKLEHLVLGVSMLSGTIPTELGNLTNLRDLDLNSLPFLSGTFPTELGVLSKLEFLALPQRSKITGSVPSNICNLLAGPDSSLLQIYGPCSNQCACCVQDVTLLFVDGCA